MELMFQKESEVITLAEKNKDHDIRQFERHVDQYGNVTHITKRFNNDGSHDIYVDKMTGSDEEKYLKSQREKGFRD